MDKATENKIVQLQMLEQNIQHLMVQKQQLQHQLIEIENSLEELNKDPEELFKIVGAIMIKSDNASVQKDLNSKREFIEVKIKNIEKQEDQIKNKAKLIQEEVLKSIEKNE